MPICRFRPSAVAFLAAAVAATALGACGSAGGGTAAKPRATPSARASARARRRGGGRVAPTRFSIGPAGKAGYTTPGGYFAAKALEADIQRPALVSTLGTS